MMTPIPFAALPEMGTHHGAISQVIREMGLSDLSFYSIILNN